MPRITFLHPDLGIGGAERLVVDAAVGLKKQGNIVHIVTTHHDKTRAFKETVNGEISVTVVGDWIPRSIFNYCYALMAYVRMIYAAIYIILFSRLNSDVVFCDLVSVAVPILKLKVNHVVFYCHYPDQLLSSPKGFLKALYRAPLNWLEEISMEKADHIFVNSKFTAKVFKKTFKKLRVDVDVLYPSLNMKVFDTFESYSLPSILKSVVMQDTIIFLSINRYERKKNLKLALLALNKLKNLVSENDWNRIHLIMAGGYDSRLMENVEHFDELSKIKCELNLDHKVTFLKSISDSEKITLLKNCSCLIYTPSNEHFGIVPIEAMYLGKPVIAVNNGGPLETIVHENTGYLCNSIPDDFAMAMKNFVVDKNLSQKLGNAGKSRVCSKFSFEEFTLKLNKTIYDLMNKKTK